MKLDGKCLTLCDVGCYFLQFDFHCQRQGHYHKHRVYFWQHSCSFCQHDYKNGHAARGKTISICHEFPHFRYDFMYFVSKGIVEWVWLHQNMNWNILKVTIRLWAHKFWIWSNHFIIFGQLNRKIWIRSFHWYYFAMTFRELIVITASTNTC